MLSEELSFKIFPIFRLIIIHDGVTSQLKSRQVLEYGEKYDQDSSESWATSVKKLAKNTIKSFFRTDMTAKFSLDPNPQNLTPALTRVNVSPHK